MMTEYTVLRASHEHLEGIARIEELCFTQPWSQGSLGLLVSEMGTGLVALSPSGDVIGYVGLLLAVDEGQITRLAVHPDHRREGIGRALMQALIEDARARGLTLLSLEVRVSNEAAKGLYRAHGFSEAGVRRGFYKLPVEDGLVMLRPLDPFEQDGGKD